MESSQQSLLKEARKQVAAVFIENLDPSIGQAFDTLSRIFQLDKQVVVKVALYFSKFHCFQELMSSIFTLLVVRGNQECHLRIKQLVEQASPVSMTQVSRCFTSLDFHLWFRIMLRRSLNFAFSLRQLSTSLHMFPRKNKLLQ